MAEMFIQEDPGLKRRRALAEAMIGQGMQSGPVGHWVEGLGRVAQSWAGNKLAKDVDTEQKARQQAAMDALTKAMMPSETKDPTTGQVTKTEPSYDSLAAAMSQNPDLAPLALQLQMSNLQTKAKTQAELEAAMRKPTQVGDQLVVPRGSGGTPEVLFEGRQKAPEGMRYGATGELEPIPGYVDMRSQIARAGRQSITNNIGPTGVDYGEPEKGLAWARNPDGSVQLDDRGAPIALPYKGGSVYREEKEADEKGAKRQGEKEKYADIVTQDIDRVIDLMEKAIIPTTGMVGSVAQNIPGTSAHNIQQLATGIRANITFDKLQGMREASPTGGALGQVSDFENRLMAATLGSLEQSQTEEQFLYNLRRVKDIYLRIINEGIKPGDPIVREIQNSGAIEPAVNPQINDLVNKYANPR